MTEEQFNKAEPYEPMEGFRKLIGIILISIGAIIALWAAVNVYRIFTEPRQLEVFKSIIPDRPELRELDIDGKKVVLPEGLFLFFSYGIAALLLFIATSIGTAFIASGVNLLMSNYRRLELKVTTEMAKLKRKIAETKAAISRKSDSE
jgi:hypothetical protein